MFGWEFPPHISGGLGTACYGITRGLATVPNLDVLFVVPKAFGDEDRSKVEDIIGANDISIIGKRVRYSQYSKNIGYMEVESELVPYCDPKEYFRLRSRNVSDGYRYYQTDEAGKFRFSGGYGPTLLTEIENYAVIASVIASEHSFDVIHAHDWLCYPAGIAAKEASGKPLVVHVHATDFDRSGGSCNPTVFDIEKRGMEAADKVITVSNLTRNTVIEKYGIPAEKVVTVYNAVDPLRNEMKNFAPKGLDEKIVTFLGRITMQKGPEYFIETAYKVLQKMDNVRFVMAGNGDMMDKMIRRAASLKIMDKFSFTGFLRGQDVYSMLNMSDLYVMPSVSEPFGISPLEAMQTGVPVLISHQSGVAEILTYALKTDFWDVDAMADAIYGVLNYPALGKMFSKYGKEEVDALMWENSAIEIKRVYDSVVK